MLGTGIQLVLSVALALLFLLVLRRMAAWFTVSAHQARLSYLYVLLLPCTFVVWVVRFGFGLDNQNLSAAQYPFNNLPFIWALIAMTGAAATFFVVIVIFEKISLMSQEETEKAVLNSQMKEQKIYLAEAKKRDEQLRSFQHDINNHLAVLSGLLKEQKYEEAQSYFQKLQLASAYLRPHIRTGSAVLDVLLQEKVGYAEQHAIAVSCQACLPHGLPIDELDLCIIVSNALDNAIQACLKPGHDRPKIEILIKVKHHFLLIEVENPLLSPVSLVPGTGLHNIQRTAEKYQGNMETEQNRGRFRLSVLLCLETPCNPPITEQKQPFT